jgi:hypothetical protein
MCIVKAMTEFRTFWTETTPGRREMRPERRVRKPADTYDFLNRKYEILDFAKSVENFT